VSFWVDAVRDLGFPAAVCLILLWLGKDMVKSVTNELAHKVDGLGADVKDMKEAMIALLEYFRNGPAPKAMKRHKR
jgi:hypothetical protein